MTKSALGVGIGLLGAMLAVSWILDWRIALGLSGIALVGAVLSRWVETR